MREILREKSVEKRISKTDGAPAEPHQEGCCAKLTVLEKGSYVAEGKGHEVLFDDISSGHPRGYSRNPLDVRDGIQDLLSEPSLLSVSISNAMDDSNSFRLSPLR